MANEKGEIKAGIKNVGNEISGTVEKKFDELSDEVLSRKLIPKEALGMSDAMIEGIYGQAYRLYNTGKYKDAIQLFRLLVTLDSLEPKYSMGLAACFHMSKDYKSAVNTYTLCGLVDTKSPIPHYHASDCYIQMKDPLSAIIALEMAIKRARDKPEYQALKDRAQLTVESLKKELKGEGAKEAGGKK